MHATLWKSPGGLPCVCRKPFGERVRDEAGLAVVKITNIHQ